MKQEVIIVDKKKFDSLKKFFIKGGAEKIHVLGDFDKTLTRAFADGQKAHTIIAQVRQGNYLTKDYSSRAHALFEKYHPTEIDPKIPLDEKKEKMHEWWKTHFELLVECGFDKKTINKIISMRGLKFRDGALDFFDYLHNKDIPLVIISAAMGDMIIEYLKQENRFYDNVGIIANFYQWDKKGKAEKIKEPMIHSMNKDETMVSDFPEIYQKIKNRKNVILLGDSLEDPDMVTGFDYSNLIRIGFLNEDVENNLEFYKKKYDVILTGDQDFSFVNNLLEELVK